MTPSGTKGPRLRISALDSSHVDQVERPVHEEQLDTKLYNIIMYLDKINHDF